MTDALTPATDLVARFDADLKPLVARDARIGIAVSGGPDSLALLLLAAASRTGRIEAATVDHQLREESAKEAAFVRSICERLDVPHVTLPVEVAQGPDRSGDRRPPAARGKREGSGIRPLEL